MALNIGMVRAFALCIAFIGVFGITSMPSEAQASTLNFKCQMHDSPYLSVNYSLYSSIEGTPNPYYPSWTSITDAQRASLQETIRSTCYKWAQSKINSYSTLVYPIGYWLAVSGAGYLYDSSGTGHNIVSPGQYVYKTSAPYQYNDECNYRDRNGRYIFCH